jgi:hypothetical protein
LRMPDLSLSKQSKVVPCPLNSMCQPLKFPDPRSIPPEYSPFKSRHESIEGPQPQISEYAESRRITQRR